MKKIQIFILIILLAVIMFIYAVNAVRIRISETILPQINAIAGTISVPLEITSLLPFSVTLRFTSLTINKSNGEVMINSTASDTSPLMFTINPGTNLLLIPLKVNSTNVNNISLSQWLTGINLTVNGKVQVSDLLKIKTSFSTPIKI